MSDDDDEERNEYSDNASDDKYSPSDADEESDDDEEEEDEEDEDDVKQLSTNVSSSVSSRRVSSVTRKTTKMAKTKVPRRSEQRKQRREKKQQTELLHLLERDNRLTDALYESSSNLNDEYGHLGAVFATKSKGVCLEYVGKYDLPKAVQTVCWSIVGVATTVLFITSTEKIPERSQSQWLGIQVAQIACALSPNLRSVELSPQVFIIFAINANFTLSHAYFFTISASYFMSHAYFVLHMLFSVIHAYFSPYVLFFPSYMRIFSHTCFFFFFLSQGFTKPSSLFEDIIDCSSTTAEGGRAVSFFRQKFTEALRISMFRRMLKFVNR